jgi:hypothetical protein
VRAPGKDALPELLRWEPAHGVVSVYVDRPPADRGEGWRIELRNGLAVAVERAREEGDRDAWKALEATAKRIFERLEAAHPEGRTQIAFVEVSTKPAREEWFAVQMPIDETEVVHDARPALRPLLAILDDGAPRGVAAVSSERIRLLRWELGMLEELEDWDLEIFSLDWRERRAQRPSDPARVQGAKASGRDQFDQRLEHNRDRFLHEAGRLAAHEVRQRGSGELLAVGDAPHVREFAEGARDGIELVAIDTANLISAPAHEIADRLQDLIAKRNRAREVELVERIKDQAHGGVRGALGIEETFQALTEGRVEHLVFDAAIRRPVPESVAAGDGLPLGERMVELALATSARVTPVEGEAAEALGEAEGVGALLRY